MNSEQRYLIYNATDGVLASPDTMTHDEATAFVHAFAHRYARQGYYLTAQREKRRPEDAELTIIRVDAAATLPVKRSARKPTGPRKSGNIRANPLVDAKTLFRRHGWHREREPPRGQRLISNESSRRDRGTEWGKREARAKRTPHTDEDGQLKG